MALAFRHGQMERDMKDFGNTIKHADAGSFGMLMAMCLKENGLMIKLMDTVSMFI